MAVEVGRMKAGRPEGGWKSERGKVMEKWGRVLAQDVDSDQTLSSPIPSLSPKNSPLSGVLLWPLWVSSLPKTMGCVETRGDVMCPVFLSNLVWWAKVQIDLGSKTGSVTVYRNLVRLFQVASSIHICKMGIVMLSYENASPTLLAMQALCPACLSFHILPFMLLLPPNVSRKEGTQRTFLKSTAVIKMSAIEEKEPVPLWWRWRQWMIYVQRNGYTGSCYILKASCRNSMKHLFKWKPLWEFDLISFISVLYPLDKSGNSSRQPYLCLVASSYWRQKYYCHADKTFTQHPAPHLCRQRRV